MTPRMRELIKMMQENSGELVRYDLSYWGLPDGRYHRWAGYPRNKKIPDWRVSSDMVFRVASYGYLETAEVRDNRIATKMRLTDQGWAYGKQSPSTN